MYTNDSGLQLQTFTTSGSTMTKEERYELIAHIAQRFNASRETVEAEEDLIWDSNDIDVDFSELVNHYE